MVRIAEIADLQDPSGQRNAHSKVMIFGVTAAVIMIVTIVLVLNVQHLTWPDVAALGLLLLAPYGLDGYKTLLKLRFAVQPPPDSNGLVIGAPGAIDRRRRAAEAEGVEVAP